MDGNVCQLGGHDNTFLGYKPRLYRKIAADALASIDVIMFGECECVGVSGSHLPACSGHVMYEMMTGKELSDVVPSEHEYGYI